MSVAFPPAGLSIFSKGSLAQLLAALYIDYLHLGEKLGGYRKGSHQAFTTTPDFERGIKAIEETADQKMSVILRAKKLPRPCHCHFITAELGKRTGM